MATLVSVNVGMPKDVPWQGQVVHTGIWKTPVSGRAMVRRLNIDGDGQGDLAGHGGEHRAVMVYQTDSYRYWEAFLGRPPMEPGSFGENFTVDGLADAEVCIGDRYRIGEALLEVTQPRVTCYRVGMRLQWPQMPSLLVAHRRPGFYCRVIEEGRVGAGDVIVKERSGGGMTVAEIDALLYLPDHPRDALERAIALPALSQGWKGSFQALLDAGPAGTGNAGLSAVAPETPAWTGFRDVRVRATREESAAVCSFVVEAEDGTALPTPRAGQFIVVKLTPPAPRLPLVRSYSISDGSTAGRYRFSVKRGEGEGSAFLHEAVRAGAQLAISAPRGNFHLASEPKATVFWGAGIGITPLLAMLHELAMDDDAGSREVYWVYGTRSGADNVFVDEVRDLLSRVGRSHRLIAFSKPGPDDRHEYDYDVEGRIDANAVVSLGVPPDAHFYLCGPSAFMASARSSLIAAGYADDAISSELFGTTEALRPGIAATATVPPHLPASVATEGPVVSFVRSGISLHWDPRHANLLELAEACDVPVRWSCRSGVCHTCETAMVDGSVTYDPDPLQPPAEGRILLCCARPSENVELDI